MPANVQSRGTPDVTRRAYSPAELAAVLGCTRQHIQNLIARGELPSFKLGHRRFIPAQVLDELEKRALGVSA